MPMIDMALMFEILLFSFSWLWLNFLLIFIMHFLMPRNVLETYFKEPYFKSSEMAAFSGVPFGYVRTLMFMRILGFPSSGKKRGVENAHEIAPLWFCWFSKYTVISFLLSFSLFLLILVIVGIHMMWSKGVEG